MKTAKEINIWQALRLTFGTLAALAVTAISAAELSEETSNAPIQKMTVNGETVHYRMIGEGEPLLMANRFRADMNHWDPIYIDQLAKSRKVILYDRPGVGLNTDMTKSSMDEMADDMIAIMDAFKLEQTDVVGWSLGTSVAMTAAAKHPERFGQMVLIGAIYSGGMQQAYITPDIQGFIDRASKPEPKIEDFVYILFGDTQASKGKGVQSLKRRALWQTPNEPIPVLSEEQWRRHVKAIEGYQGDPDTIERLKAISSPLLFINGDRDHIAPPRIGAEYIQHIKGSQFAVINSSGHNVHGQDPEKIAAMTLEFVNQ